MKWPKLLLLISMLLSPVCYAGVDLQAHVRTGMIEGTFVGADSGNFAMTTSLEGELEMFYSNRTSFQVKTTAALGQENSQIVYLSMSLGQKYYLFTRGRPIESYDEGVYSLMVPRWRFYTGYTIGIAQVETRFLSASLSATSTIFEIGGGAGVIYNFSRNIGINIDLLYGKGFGVSSVAIDATVIRGLVGVVSYF